MRHGLRPNCSGDRRQHTKPHRHVVFHSVTAIAMRWRGNHRNLSTDGAGQRRISMYPAPGRINVHLPIVLPPYKMLCWHAPASPTPTITPSQTAHWNSQCAALGIWASTNTGYRPPHSSRCQLCTCTTSLLQTTIPARDRSCVSANTFSHGLLRIKTKPRARRREIGSRP